MVRINIVQPHTLTDQHLMAEHVETLMLFKYLTKTKHRPKDAPTEYTLGRGHMKFFWDKATYLDKRFKAINDELIRRGYKIHKHTSLDLNLVTLEQLNDYNPTIEAYQIITCRIIERIRMKPNWYTFYKEHVSLKAWEAIYK